MAEMDIVDSLGIQKERLDNYLKKEFNPEDKVKVFYRTIAETDEEARSRKIEQLTIDVEKKQKKYIESLDDDVEKMILYRYGADDEKEVHILRKIYEKIETYMQENESEIITNTSSFCVDKFFTNLSYKQFCPSCSGMVDVYKTGLLKKLATYQRCSSLFRNKSSLTFTTLYWGTWVRILVISDCPKCCSSSDEFTITSNPVIENVNDNQKLLIDDPLDFVKTVVIKWLEKCCLK